MVLSEYWKKLEENFRKRWFPRFPKNDENLKKNPLALFNILKEPLLVQKQTIHQLKALDLSFNLTSQKWAWHYQEGATPTGREKHILLNFMGSEGFWLLAFYDLCRKHFWRYSQFQGVILKLNTRAFFWGIVCFSTGSISIMNINLNIFPDFAYPPCSMYWWVWAEIFWAVSSRA